MPEQTVSVCPATKAPCAVHQSFAEVSGGFQVQENCPDCGTGKGFLVDRATGLEMIAAQELRQVEVRKAMETKAKAEVAAKAAKQPSK